MRDYATGDYVVFDKDNGSVPYVLTHELGHLICSLSDHYWAIGLIKSAQEEELRKCSGIIREIGLFGDSSLPKDGNGVPIIPRDMLPWAPLIDEDVPIPTSPPRPYFGRVGCFGSDNVLFTSDGGCLMNGSTDEGFCLVCQHAFVVKVLSLTTPFQDGDGAASEAKTPRLNLIPLPDRGFPEDIPEVWKNITRLGDSDNPYDYEISWLVDGATVPLFSGKTELTEAEWKSKIEGSPSTSSGTNDVHAVVARVRDKVALVYNPYNPSLTYHFAFGRTHPEGPLAEYTYKEAVFGVGGFPAIHTQWTAANIREEDQPFADTLKHEFQWKADGESFTASGILLTSKQAFLFITIPELTGKMENKKEYWKAVSDPKVAGTAKDPVLATELLDQNSNLSIFGLQVMVRTDLSLQDAQAFHVEANIPGFGSFVISPKLEQIPVPTPTYTFTPTPSPTLSPTPWPLISGVMLSISNDGLLMVSWNYATDPEGFEIHFYQSGQYEGREETVGNLRRLERQVTNPGVYQVFVSPVTGGELRFAASNVVIWQGIPSPTPTFILTPTPSFTPSPTPSFTPTATPVVTGIREWWMWD